MTALHDPYASATPTQRRAAGEHRKRTERFQYPFGKDQPPIPNSEIRRALELVGVPPEKLQVDTVQRAVASFYGVTLTDIKSDRRFRDVTKHRHVAMYLACTETGRSSAAVGRQFGDRDHSTVIYAMKRIARLIKTDAKLAAEIESIKAKLQLTTG